MKKLILFLIDMLMWIPGLIFNEKIAYIFTFLSDTFYGSYIRHRFKRASHIKMFGHPIVLRGGKCVEVGEGVSLGKDTRIEAHEEYNGVRFHPRIKIGNHVIINPLCHIGCIDSVTIGNYVVLSERCLVIDHTHGDVSYEHLSLYERERPLVSKGKVVIEDYVWMGENSVVMSGVTVGHNSLIGANAVVTKDIPPYSIVVGNPARILRTLEPPTQD